MFYIVRSKNENRNPVLPFPPTSFSLSRCCYVLSAMTLRPMSLIAVYIIKHSNEFMKVYVNQTHGSDLAK